MIFSSVYGLLASISAYASKGPGLKPAVVGLWFYVFYLKCKIHICIHIHRSLVIIFASCGDVHTYIWVVHDTRTIADHIMQSNTLC